MALLEVVAYFNIGDILLFVWRKTFLIFFLLLTLIFLAKSKPNCPAKFCYFVFRDTALAYWQNGVMFLLKKFIVLLSFSLHVYIVQWNKSCYTVNFHLLSDVKLFSYVIEVHEVVGDENLHYAIHT